MYFINFSHMISLAKKHYSVDLEVMSWKKTTQSIVNMIMAVPIYSMYISHTALCPRMKKLLADLLSEALDLQLDSYLVRCCDRWVL